MRSRSCLDVTAIPLRPCPAAAAPVRSTSEKRKCNLPRLRGSQLIEQSQTTGLLDRTRRLRGPPPRSRDAGGGRAAPRRTAGRSPTRRAKRRDSRLARTKAHEARAKLDDVAAAACVVLAGHEPAPRTRPRRRRRARAPAAAHARTCGVRRALGRRPHPRPRAGARALRRSGRRRAAGGRASAPAARHARARAAATHRRRRTAPAASKSPDFSGARRSAHALDCRRDAVAAALAHDPPLIAPRARAARSSAAPPCSTPVRRAATARSSTAVLRRRVRPKPQTAAASTSRHKHGDEALAARLEGGTEPFS